MANKAASLKLLDTLQDQPTNHIKLNRDHSQFQKRAGSVYLNSFSGLINGTSAGFRPRRSAQKRPVCTEYSIQHGRREPTG